MIPSSAGPCYSERAKFCSESFYYDSYEVTSQKGFFSEDDTSLVTEMFLRNPRSVMAKDLQTDISMLDNIPKDQL